MSKDILIAVHRRLSEASKCRIGFDLTPFFGPLNTLRTRLALRYGLTKEVGGRARVQSVRYNHGLEQLEVVLLPRQVVHECEIHVSEDAPLA